MSRLRISSSVRMPDRSRPLILAIALLTALAAVIAGLGGVPRASAVSAPVVIDDFSGNVHGTRTVTLLPTPDSSTTPQATFDQSGGVATMVMTGNGNGRAGAQLSYSFGATDLTSGGSNAQFFIEFSSITRTPTDPGQPAAYVSISATDSSGTTGTYSTSISDIGAQAIVLNFDCSASAVCFSPTLDFTHITSMQLTILYPQNNDTTHSTTVVLDALRTTPTGGAAPTPPSAQITAPAANDPDGVVYGPSGTTLDFPVSFTSDGQPADVDHTSGGDDGLRAQDLLATGTAPGSDQLSVTGGPSSYVVHVGPITGDGTVGFQLPAGIVFDSWDQGNTPAESSITFAVWAAPQISSDPPPGGLVGTAYTHQFTATGAPAPTFALSSGALPPGLSLSSDGLLSGTPTAPGSYTFTVAATNLAGTDSQPVSIQVLQAPAFTSATTAIFRSGTAGTFTVTTSGAPDPAIAVFSGTLPDGLSLIDNGDGTATISGTPTTDGSRTVTLTASSSAGSAQQNLTIEAQSAPAFTSADSATFSTGIADTFTVTTSGVPAPAITIASGALPAGLTLTDNGDGTATISGTPTAAGQATVTLSAANAVTTAQQILTIAIQQAPAISAPSGTQWTEAGSTLDIPIGTTGYPVAAVTAATLPSWLILTDNGDGTATLVAAPTGAEAPVTVDLTAHNGVDPDAHTTVTVGAYTNPAITSPDSTTFVTGTTGTFTVETSGFPAPTISAVGLLPAGLTLTDNSDGTATISGVPTTTGTTQAQILATGQFASASQLLTITVVQTPVFTSGDKAVFQLGSDTKSFDITTSADPAASIVASGTLPAGLALTDHGDGTATLNGTPTVSGEFVVPLTASNGGGSATQQLTVDIGALVAFTSAPNAAFTESARGSFQVTTTGYPVSVLSLTGTLPAGLTFTDNGDGTATISGTPAAGTAGSYQVVVSAAQPLLPDPDQALTITISPAAATGPATPATSATAGISPASVSLPYTGAPVAQIAAIAAFCLAAGTGLVIAGRRRRGQRS